MFYSMIADLPFGIDVTKILLHLLNFAILAVGLTFLLYKPILKFIKKRQDEINANIQKGEKMQEEADSLKEEYEQKLKNVDEEADAIKKEAEQQAHANAEKIIRDALDDASKIKEQAKVTAKELERAAVVDAKKEIAEAVVSLTEDLIEREITKEDNVRIIENSLADWKNKL